MRHLSGFAAGAALMMLPALALADQVVISPEVDTYVTTQPVPENSMVDFNISIGAPVPDTVQVIEVPSSDYGYVVVNKRRVLVDRKTNKVVKIYE